ncbi:ABC transporter permease [Algibacillus agarilyticus]|uniref:ABC transporter permease n=1 Tax=Algibacillus agarilyticus TaxID=2234133 RepID=UPI000DCFD4FD|nr:FtsX-like permease family protein [Algibacillus agarilyticus]
MLFNLSYRLLKHELKRNELTIMLIAIILAVASVYSLSSFSQKMQDAINVKSSEFLAADGVLSSGKPINERLMPPTELGLQTADQIRFSSMVFFNDEMMLATVKAVDNAYPLKGTIFTQLDPFGHNVKTNVKLSPGEVWLSAKFFQTLSVALGDSVEIGDAIFKVTAILGSTPDQGFSPFTTGAQVLIHIDDVPSTQVIQPGSRIHYRSSFTGSPEKMTQYEEWLLPQLSDDLHRWKTINDESTPVGNSIKKASRYFLIASLISVLLAAAAVGVAATQYAERHFDMVAIFKTIGATKKQIIEVFTLHLSLLILVGVSVGLGVGYIIEWGVFEFIKAKLPVELQIQTISYKALYLAAFTGITCAGAFSIVPMLKLFNASPLRVIRRDMLSVSSYTILAYIVSVLSIFMLMYLFSQSLMISSILFVGSLAAVALLLAMARFGIWLSRKASKDRHSALKLAIARLYVNARSSSLQLISLTIAVQLFLLVLVLRGDLIGQWQNQLKEGTPNYFIVNVPHHQKTVFETSFSENNIEVTDLYPIIRGRLIAVNNEVLFDEVSKEKPKKADENRRESIGRELNLTTHQQIPYMNTLVEGEWWTKSTTDSQVSIEEKLAKRMKIKLGDELKFMITGSEINVKVTSIRKVKWESMTPNFFMIFSDDVLADFNASYIASFHLPTDRAADLNQLMMQFPTSSLIDINQILAQMKQIAGQASMAIEFIFVLVLIAGVLVIQAQIQASMATRKQEVMVLRILGASSHFISRSIAFEFMFLGALAGLLAAITMEIILAGVQILVFKMQWSPHFEFIILSPIACALILGIFGQLACSRVLLRSVKTQASTL